MNQPMSLERMVAAWMAEEAVDRGADELTDRILTATATRRPLPRWLALLKEPPMVAQTRVAVGAPHRRLALLVALLLGVAIAAAAAGAFFLRQPTAIADWPGFRGGPSHDGTGLSGPIGQPVEAWTVEGLGPIKNNIAVAAGVVLVPSEDGVLRGLSIKDGSEAWAFRPGSSMTGPVADGTTAYVTDGNGYLHAIDLATGAARWSSTSAVAGASSASLGDGAVFVGTGDGRIVAVEAADGRQRWATSVAANDAGLGSPAFADGLVYGASSTGGVVALRASDGEVAWRADLAGDPVGTLVVTGGRLYAGATADSTDGRLRSFDAKTGEPVWSVDEPLFSPSVSEGLAISGSGNGVISARDAATGAERWRFITEGTNRAPSIAAGIAFVPADGQRRIYALDVRSGGLLWDYPVEGENQCCLALASGLVLAGTMDGTVYALGGDGTTIAPRVTIPPTAPAPSAASAPPPPPLPDPFSVTATYTSADLGLDRPLDLAIAPSGDIYVTDRSDRVTRIDPTGHVIQRWGGNGSGAGRFDFSPASINENPHGSIAIGPDGSVYISDNDNHRVQVFTPDGTFVRRFGSQGSDPGQFELPFDLTADARGNVYVLDDGTMRLTKFTSTGDVVWVADSSTEPMFAGHGHTPTFDPEGRLVISVDDNGQVLYLDPDDGTLVDSFLGDGCDATVDAAGNVYVDDCGSEGRIRVFDRDHTLIAESRTEVSGRSPRFGSAGQAAVLGADGSIILVTVDPPTR